MISARLFCTVPWKPLVAPLSPISDILFVREASQLSAGLSFPPSTLLLDLEQGELSDEGKVRKEKVKKWGDKEKNGGKGEELEKK